MTRPDIEAIEARLGAATAGQWELWDGNSWRRIGIKGRQGAPPIIAPTNSTKDGWPDLTGPNLYNDLRLIEHAPTDLATLLAYVKELEAKCEPKPIAKAHECDCSDCPGGQQ